MGEQTELEIGEKTTIVVKSLDAGHVDLQIVIRWLTYDYGLVEVEFDRSRFSARHAPHHDSVMRQVPKWCCSGPIAQKASELGW